MDKIGIPRGLFYYYYGDIWKYFFENLKISYIVSPNTNKEIMEKALKASGDEMCLSLKTYLGHVEYLKDKCQYILIPRISNYKKNNQTCTNFWAVYDIVKNQTDTKLLHYNIDLEKRKTLKKGLYKIAKQLGKEKHQIRKAYKNAIIRYKKQRKKEISINLNKLKSDKTKILIVSHPYNTYDSLIGKDIIKYLIKNDVEVIYCDKFSSKITNKLGETLAKELYFKYSKDNIGSIVYCKDKIDGIIFISSFPCAPDSLVNELVMRKIKIPNINLIIDDNSSFTGLETRLESFLDMLGGLDND